MRNPAPRKGKKKTEVKVIMSSAVAPVRARKARPRKESLSERARKYLLACTDPFSLSAIGCRTPDAFVFPTISNRVEGQASIGSTATIAAVLFTPNPYVCAVDMSNSFYTGLFTGYNNNSTIYSPLANGGSLSTYYEKWRPVAGGISVSYNGSMTNCGGRVVCAPFVLGALFPTPNELNNYQCSAASYVRYTGYSAATLASTAIIDYPGAFEVSIAELFDRGIVLPFRPVDPTSAKFRDCGSNSTTWNSTYNDATVVTDVSATGVIQATADSTTVDYSGWMGWLVQVFNPTANGTIDVKYVLHTEGTIPGSTGSTGFVPESAPLQRDSKPSDWSKVMDELTKVPWMKVVRATTDVLDYVGVGGPRRAHGRQRLNIRT
jgi:hypothetical protein